MDNYAIADNLSMLGKLMDIHGDNSFKAKSYTAAAFTIEKLPVPLQTLSAEKIFSIKGIGETTGKKILEQIETGRLAALDEYVLKTPVGILEMMNIKGLGPKKIQTIWKELCVENLGELLYACDENRLLLYKGFGAKTQQNIKESIEFYMSNQGSFLYSQIDLYTKQFSELLEANFTGKKFLLSGDFNRHALIVHKLIYVSDVESDMLEEYFKEQAYSTETKEGSLFIKGPQNVSIQFHCVTLGNIYRTFFEHNCSSDFLEKWKEKFGWNTDKEYANEEEIFTTHNVPFIPPFLREDASIIERSIEDGVPEVVQPADIKGIIHSHSDWSDGVNTIEEMARHAIEKGLEYLVISDHSKSAYYAKGLYPERIVAQHQLIDELNIKFKPFKIFKSIESDILNDGSLDYEDAVLETFDLVITSIHSNFKMTEEKAVARLIKAIENPYTTILGHMTGRLLLSRNGYPVNHKEVIDACSKNNVVIEVNAHPRRLDMDYKFIPYALKKGVLLSIDPDAHSYNTFDHTCYGVLAAQKGGLTKADNLSSFSLVEFEGFLQQQKAKRLTG
ncbi:MAG: polymerase/3-5 exonuclease PolX [Segetibacter sp.]|nr:polymerase/3-5 exonuclease PolX [Segetibacter sp.]